MSTPSVRRECPLRGVFRVPPPVGRGNTDNYLCGLDNPREAGQGFGQRGRAGRTEGKALSKRGIQEAREKNSQKIHNFSCGAEALPGREFFWKKVKICDKIWAQISGRPLFFSRFQPKDLREGICFYVAKLPALCYNSTDGGLDTPGNLCRKGGT